MVSTFATRVAYYKLKVISDGDAAIVDAANA